MSESVNNIYDIHVSVDAVPDPLAFKQACEQLGVKPIMLHLISTHSDWLDCDNMSSSVLRGSDADAVAETERIAKGLMAAGFTVVRKKIESTPWHPLAVAHGQDGESYRADRYFECHFNVTLADEIQLGSLIHFAKQHTLHLSRNLFKKRADGSSVVMATLRDYLVPCEVFKAKVAAIAEAAHLLNFKVEKQVIEFAMFDTKTDHDDAWLTS